MTYHEAKRWLAKIGGDWKESKERAPPCSRGSILVSVKSAKGPIVHRHAHFDDTTAGVEREIGIRRAFVLACEELRRALD